MLLNGAVKGFLADVGAAGFIFKFVYRPLCHWKKRACS